MQTDRLIACVLVVLAAFEKGAKADYAREVAAVLAGDPWIPQASFAAGSSASTPEPKTAEVLVPSPPQAPAPAAPVHSAGELIPLAESSPAPPVVRPQAPQSPSPVVVAPSMPAGEPFEIQLAALSSPEVSRRMRQRLESILGSGQVREVRSEGWFRLRWGRFADRASAERALADLRTRGIDGFVTAVSP